MLTDLRIRASTSIRPSLANEWPSLENITENPINFIAYDSA